jgi:tetratricopeptide (TPR) repeat protein
LPKSSNISEKKTSAAIDRRPIWIAVALSGLVLIVFSQAIGHQFVDFDDDAYVLNNAAVRSGFTGSGLMWAFTSVRFFYWQPLTWMSHMLDSQLYGLNPAGHHFTSILIHAANAILLFFVLRRLTKRLYASAFAAALWAMHPLRVESVGWVAERKDVLSGLFFLLTLYAYAIYVEHPSSRRYLAVVALFLAALMSKPAVVALPAVLLLMDYWPLRRAKSWGELVTEKLPLFVLSAASSAITILGEHQIGAMASLERLPFMSRLLNAPVAYAEYLAKTLWPAKLAILYPLASHTSPIDALACVALLALVSAAAFVWRKRYPWALVGWLWFISMLVPTIGIFQTGTQALADRFTYLPHIGLAIALVWTAAELRFRPVFGVAIVGLLGIRTWAQTQYWTDSITVAQHAIAVTGANAVMEHDLAFALAEQGRRAEAIDHYARSLAIDPNDYGAEYNIGRLLVEDNRPAEALSHFRKSVEMNPNYAAAHYALGLSLAQKNDRAGSKHELELAVRGGLPRETEADAHNRLGLIEGVESNFVEAERQFAAAAALEPELTPAYLNYARALAAENKRDEARAYLTRVLAERGENPVLRQFLNTLSN